MASTMMMMPMKDDIKIKKMMRDIKTMASEDDDDDLKIN